MVLRTWRIYARVNDAGEPTEFSYVSCDLAQTKNFILWETVRGTADDAKQATHRNERLYKAMRITYQDKLKEIQDEYPEVR